MRRTTFTACVLLAQAPGDIAELWHDHLPEHIGSPDAQGIDLVVGGVAVTARLRPPVMDRELSRAGKHSPQAEHVSPLIVQHAAVLEFRVRESGPPGPRMTALCQAILSLPPQPDAVVWVPYRHQATTQMEFARSLAEEPSRAFYCMSVEWTSPARVTAVACARGLSVLGCDDVQVTGSPEHLQDLADQLEDYVREAIRLEELPQLEGWAVVRGAIVELTPALDPYTGATVAELPPASADPAASVGSPFAANRTFHEPADEAIQVAPLTGPYAQLAAAFAHCEGQGFVARMNFTSCENCGGDRAHHIEAERTPVDSAGGIPPAAGSEQPADEPLIYDPLAPGAYPFRERGYVFFSPEDVRELADGSTQLHLSFDAFAGSDLAPAPEGGIRTQELAEEFADAVWDGAVAAGRLVSAALEQAGLDVDWDETPDSICVRADFSAAPFPWRYEPREGQVASSLQPADSGLGWNASWLLLESRPEHLGELVTQFLPNTAARWVGEGALAGEIPNRDTGVTLWLSLTDRIEDPQLMQHVATSDDPEAAAAQVQKHAAALCMVGGGRADVYEQVVTQFAVIAGIAEENSGALGIWTPGQDRYDADPAVVIADDAPHLLHVRVFCVPDGAVDVNGDDVDMFYTRGMRRFGQVELVLAMATGESREEAIAVLQMMALDLLKAGRTPQAGERIRVRSRAMRTLLHDADDPVTGEPALLVELVDRTRMLGGLFYRD